MTAYITIREELTHGAFLVVMVPWRDIEAPQACETTITRLSAEIGAVLRAMADPVEAAVALRGEEEEAA